MPPPRVLEGVIAAAHGGLPELLGSFDADHLRVAAALHGRPSSAPSDGELADLHAAVLQARAAGADRSAIDVLLSLVEEHEWAVVAHLAWMEIRAHAVVPRLLAAV